MTSLFRPSKRSSIPLQPLTEHGERPKNVRIIRRVSRFFLSLVLLLVATAVFFSLLVIVSYLVIGYFIRGEEIEVPDLTARSVTEALHLLKPWDIALVMDREEPSDTLPVGEIISQRPGAGSKIKAHAQVRVVISAGHRLVELPSDLIGRSRLEVGIRLRELGLEVGNVTQLPRVGQKSDIVLDMDPPIGTGVPPGSSINLLVSSENQSFTFMMPDLVGLTPALASSALDSYGLRLGSTREGHGPGISPGTIYEQKPEAGSLIGPSSEIEVIVEPPA